VTRRTALWVIVLIVAQALDASAQTRVLELAYRGFADVGVVAYPQEAPNDPTRAVADGQFRFEPSMRVRRVFSVAASLEARVDSHDQTESDFAYWDRAVRRPSFAVRSLTATFVKSRVTLEVGKQFVRWGQSDIISPTDHFTARDYLVTTSSEVLATTAARLTYAAPSDALEFVYSPRMTPSRMPLLDQRWVGLQASLPGVPLADGEIRYPGGPQYGARWRHLGSRVEFSASLFKGFNHLALLDVTVPATRDRALIGRRYPAIRAWGADAAVPLPGVTLKAETTWQEATSNDADDYGLWVVQAERQQADWLLIGGYVGEWVTAERGALSFAPDRGLAKSLIGRASRTLERNRSVLVEAVARQNGDGLYAKGEYSHGVGAHWRVTLQGVLLRGSIDDFLGQYRLNSWTGARTRFSF
jgi:hypothetical protein